MTEARKSIFTNEKLPDYESKLLIKCLDMALGKIPIDFEFLPKLAILIEGCSESLANISTLIARILVENYPITSQIIDTLLNSRNFKSRIRATYCLPTEADNNYLKEVLNKLTSDKSSAVRKSAFDWIFVQQRGQSKLNQQQRGQSKLNLESFTRINQITIAPAGGAFV